MKIDPRQLPVLMDFNQQVFQIRKLEAEASRIAAGEELESIRVALLVLSAQASQMLSDHEEIERDLRRSETDLELVEARIAKDEQRLTQSSDAKTITGIQHELITLGKRKGDLEEAQLPKDWLRSPGHWATATSKNCRQYCLSAKTKWRSEV